VRCTRSGRRAWSDARKPVVQKIEDILNVQAVAGEVGGGRAGEPGVEEVEDVLHGDEAVGVEVADKAEACEEVGAGAVIEENLQDESAAGGEGAGEAVGAGAGRWAWDETDRVIGAADVDDVADADDFAERASAVLDPDAGGAGGLAVGGGEEDAAAGVDNDGGEGCEERSGRSARGLVAGAGDAVERSVQAGEDGAIVGTCDVGPVSVVMKAIAPVSPMRRPVNVLLKPLVVSKRTPLGSVGACAPLRAVATRAPGVPVHMVKLPEPALVWVWNATAPAEFKLMDSVETCVPKVKVPLPEGSPSRATRVREDVVGS
jgi:hypothetical protein